MRFINCLLFSTATGTRLYGDMSRFARVDYQRRYPQEVLENVSDALSALLEAYEPLHRPLPKVLERESVNHSGRFETRIAVP